MTTHLTSIAKRAFLGLLAGTALIVSACARSADVATANLSPEDKRLRHKYRGIGGGVLYFDASGYRKKFVTMRTQSGLMWQSTEAGFGPGGATQLTFTNFVYIPRTIRVMWRTGDVRAKKNERGGSDPSVLGFEGGTVLGDYTVAVAERIPDEILDYIRSNGGALRIKIRLKDDGVLVGWDVEKIVSLKDWKLRMVCITRPDLCSVFRMGTTTTCHEAD